MVIKSKVFVKCNAKEFYSWDFCKNSISNPNLNCIFLVGDYHTVYEVLLTLRESLLALSQLSTPTSSLFTVSWTLLSHCRMQKLLYHQQNEQNASDLRIYYYYYEKKVGSARLRESGIHLISPNTPAPQYQPINRKKRKGIKVEDYSRDGAA